MSNLFRWGKAESPYCIYCKDVDHNSIHLLIRCPHIENIWNVLSCLEKRNLTSQGILLGIANEVVLNNILSEINFIIYKKYLIDKDKPNDMIPITQFVKFELVYSKKVYSSSNKLLFLQYSNHIKNIISIL